MVETSEIVLDNIVGSSSEFDEETGNIKGYHLDSYTAHVSPNVGFFYLTEDSICVKNDGSVKKVSLGLRNYTSVRGMEAVLSLPEDCHWIRRPTVHLSLNMVNVYHRTCLSLPVFWKTVVPNWY